MELIAVPYKSEDEQIVINLDQMVVAMPRTGKADRAGEEEGIIYTSFMMTTHIATSATLDTLLRYDKFIDEMQIVEDNGTNKNNETTEDYQLKEIVIPTREQAERVVDFLHDLIVKYKIATVSDLYDMTDIPSTHKDSKYGWEELKEVGVSRSGEGYVLDLPKPKRLED